jgi:TetR/AcrR family tetracycline transcriptional repressor
MSLDRAAIVDAALALLDRDGVEGLSTRKLAAELGIRGPSLYWHFKNKRQLLDHMAERMFREALPPPAGPDLRGFDRRAWLEAGARGLRRVALSRRDGARVMAGSRPATETAERDFAEMMGTLVRTGISPRDAGMALQLLGRFAVGWVLYEQSTDERTPAAGDAGFEFGLQSLLDGVEDRLGAGLSLQAVGG